MRNLQFTVTIVYHGFVYYVQCVYYVCYAAMSTMSDILIMKVSVDVHYKLIYYRANVYVVGITEECIACFAAKNINRVN